MARKRTGVEKNCEKCGGTFYAKPSHANRRRFCSTMCAGMPEKTLPAFITCVVCGEHRSVEPRLASVQKFCSRSCAGKCSRLAKATKTGRFTPCAHCGSHVYIAPHQDGRKRFCSKACFYAGRTLRSLFERGHDNRRAMPAITSIERAVYDFLDARGVQHEPQYLFNGKFRLDTYIPSSNLAVECDGDYWHTLPASVRNDKCKDHYLSACGVRLLRLTESEIRSRAFENKLVSGIACGQ